MRKSRLWPFLAWPCWLWTLVAAEAFLLLWGSGIVGAQSSRPELYGSSRAAWLGEAGGAPGMMPTLIFVNMVVTIGLWLFYRTARRWPRRHELPARVLALSGAAVLLALSLCALRLGRAYPSLRAVAVFEADGETGYRVRGAR